MRKGIKYSGLTNVPGDLECEDGELAAVVNLGNEGGELKAFVHPDEMFKIQGVLLCVHKGSNYQNYVTLDEGNLYTQTATSTRELIAYWIGDVAKAEVLGNTLIVIAENQPVRYLLFKEGHYIDLGHKPPFPSISFGLKGILLSTAQFQVGVDKIGEGSLYTEFSPNNKSRVTDQVLGRVNQFIQQESKDKGKFIYPFFVRYALRLYDGSLFMHSAPVLMLPSSGICPVGLVDRMSGSGGYTDLYIRVASFVCTLDYKVTNFEEELGEELNKWKDIVKSIDIFISQPIYTYDQNGQCWGLDMVNANTYPYFGIMRYNNETDSALREPLYRKLTYYGAQPTVIAMLRMPEVKKSTLRENITDNALFYKVKEISLSEITSTRKDINLKENILNILPFQEVMTDDYNSHNTITAGCSATYNARLNIGNIRQELYPGFPTESLVCFENGNKYVEGGIIWSYWYGCVTFIKEDGRDIVVDQRANITTGLNWGYYIFFPNVNAYRMIITRSVYFAPEWVEVKLTPHPGLNGAYFYGGFDDLKWSSTPLPPYSLTTTTIHYPNKLYNSEANNPFVFPVSGIVTVGTADIRALVSATKAVSQGQFGQFPMNIFTGEGIWALEISDTGSYSSRQMVARDVINNARSVLQLDGAVAFTSDRGVMLLQGSEVICVSANLTGPTFKTGKLHGIDTVIEQVGIAGIIAAINAAVPFATYLKGCSMAYDYANSRILILNAGYPYAYVFNIEMKTWSTITSEYRAATNNYPDSYLTEADGGLSNLSAVISPDDPRIVRGVAITRPLKLDDGDMLKTVTAVAHRGKIGDDKVQSVLFGSRNGEDYVPLASSKGKFIRRVHGSPYKYFRLVIIADLTKSGFLSETTFEFEAKFSNKLR